MDTLDLTRTNMSVAVADVQSLAEEDYALVRRQGFGASDISVVLRALPFKTLDELIDEKRRAYITDDERAIGKKDVVRKGRDLEPLILQKFAKLMDCEEPLKPKDMYKLNKAEYLTVNFDGVMDTEHSGYVPVECKYVSPYGDKYYNRDHAVYREIGAVDPRQPLRPYSTGNLVDYMKAKAEQVGIPAYYYAQVQHQMMALGSPHGYLAALHDKGWELCVYDMARDDYLIDKIKIEGWKAWQRVVR